MLKKTRQEIINTLLRSRNILISGHMSPDGDSLGSEISLAGFLKGRGIDFKIINDGAIPERYRFLPGSSEAINFEDYEPVHENFDCAVIIECSNLERIGKVQKLIDNDCTIVNIDHHKDNSSFGHINYLDFEASAAGEMVFDMIKQGGYRIDMQMAANIYTAILTDTGRFHFNNTTPKCLRVAAELVELGADPVYITEKVYFSMNPRMMRLAGIVLSGIEYLDNDRLCVLTIKREDFEKTKSDRGDTEGLINYTMYADSVKLGLLFTEIDSKRTKVSFRSADSIDVGSIAAHYGGGGHFNASGCLIELPLAKARQAVLDYVREKANGAV